MYNLRRIFTSTGFHMPAALDLDAFRATPLQRDPFDYLIVPRFVRREALEPINRDYPAVTERGSFPVNRVAYGPAFKGLLEDLESDAFRTAFEEKFGVALAGRPTTTTVRGRCGKGDGQIHTDSKTKIITVLIYMNAAWEKPGGRLRLLRSGDNLNDFIAEVPPVEGTLVAFRRANNSWHGHEPFEGERRVIQFNWVTSEGNRHTAMLRHHVSASIKKLLAAVRPRAHQPVS
jgi:SM-20-related protein